MATVELKDLCKTYEGDVKAVKNASISIKDGEFLVLVGPSGCGKSTLLRMVAGLESITSGTITIGESVVNGIPAKDRNIAMVFQNYALYPHMTVYQNMAFGLKLRKVNKKEIEERVLYAAKLLDMMDYLSRKPKALSGGQAQRVAVGRAIVRKPEVFLFDEPLSNLDAKLRIQMRVELAKLQKQLGTTSIYVTHDQTEAMTMGHRIAIMKDGIIQQLDTPLNVYNNPANLFVASFIGSPGMNFFKGKLYSDKELWFEWDNFKIKIPDRFKNGLSGFLNKEITIGLRPEHLSVNKGDDNDCVIKGVVDLVEQMGSDTHVYVTSGDSRLVARLSGGVSIKIDTAIEFSPDFNNIHFFDPNSTNRIIVKTT